MKKVVAFVLALAMSLSLVACGGSDSSSTPAGSTAGAGSSAAGASTAGKDLSDITVAYVCSELTNEIFAMQVEAMEAYAKELGINFVYKQTKDTGEKITACENYISSGVDAIICHVQDGPAMEDVVKEAHNAGVKFFAYDTDVEGADTFYGWDNYDYGYAIGTNAANWVNATFVKGDTVYAASCNHTANFLIVREQGYKAALEELCPDITVEWVAEGIGGNAANGVTAGENFLQVGKDINLVVGINDGGCLGVLEAFNAAGYGGDKVGIFAGDATNDALKAVKEGGIYRGTVTTGLVSLAPDFIDLAVSLAQGEAVDRENFGPTTLITAENVDEFM